MKKVTLNLPENGYSVRESLKTIRTNVLFCGDDKRVLMVTSCVPDEGKSTLSLQMARSFAELGKKVIMVDLDLRKSVMASMLGITDVEKGISHYLSGQASMEEVVVGTEIPGLHLALSGPAVPNSVELLSSEKFAKMISVLRNRYDYVILDTPPLGIVIDGVVIAKQSDGSIMVLESAKTKYRLAQNVKKKLEETGTPILGVILNKVDRAKHAGYYSKYYGGYYGRKGYGYYSRYEHADKEKKKRSLKKTKKSE